MLELHIWGPAFGLPSVEPECIATVAYFNRIVPQGQWSLVADFDTSASPEGEFPLLVDDGVRTTGFCNIVSYLRNHQSGAYDLDYNLTHQRQTDRTAFMSFLQSTATPLIDLSLYVSSENYYSLTSSAYTAILPWYTNYTIPPKRRELAKARTAHLGLSSLDVNEAGHGARGPGSDTASSEYEAAKRAAGIPGSENSKVYSMGRGKGLGGLLGSPMYAARFKLDALSNELLQPLSDLLGKHDYLLAGDKPSSLDCLAFGYLALMLYPPVPQPWLREAIQTKYPRIFRYIRRLREDLLGKGDTHSPEVWDISIGAASARLSLPWQPRPRKATHSYVLLAAREIIEGVPLLSLMVRRSPIVQSHSTPASLPRVCNSSLPSSTLMNMIGIISASVATVLAGLAIYQRRNPREGPLIFWALRPRFGGFGEAGNILSVLAGQLPQRL